MKSLTCLILLLTGFLFLAGPEAKAKTLESDFSAWMREFRSEAHNKGVSIRTLNMALAGIERPLERVIELDRKQPERALSLSEYLATRVTKRRIRRGREMRDRYPTWLRRVEKEYAVQSSFILALWGVETDYGAYTGGFSVIHVLATLAHDGRRSSYFRKELLVALKILDQGQVSLSRMKGSWAGAMGQCQFMPSSFQRYAVDADGDGRINLWYSIPDVLASTANYLKQAGWQKGQTWGYPVALPPGFDQSLTGLKTRFKLSYWRSLGVQGRKGKSLPQQDLSASLIIPDGLQGQAYLVYDNFRVLRRWNRSNAFAISVGSLADKIAVTGN